MTDTINDAPDATWTVTAEEQREFLRAYWRWWMRQPRILFVMCLMVGVIAGGMVFLELPLVLAIVWVLADGVLLAAFTRWQVRHSYPVGETLRSWADAAAFRFEGRGVGTEINWNRVTAVDIGPTAVGLRTRTPRQNLLVARQVVGDQAIARLARLTDEPVSEPVVREEVPGGRSVVVGRRLQIALCSAAARRIRVAGWITLVCTALSILLGTNDPEPWLVLVPGGVCLLLLVATLVLVVAPTFGAYPVGSTISGSMGDDLVVHGPWGHTSIHRSKLKMVATSKHAIAFRSGPTWVVVPRAIIDG